MGKTRQAGLLLGLDLGTTNCKAVIVNRKGKVIASATSGYAMHSPRQGWVQQDAQDVWKATVESLHLLAGQAPLEELGGVCLSGAMHSLLPVDEKGTPLAPALTWADQRAAEVARRLRGQTDAHALYQRTGCPLQALYHPAKLRWWVDEETQIARQASRFVAIKDWIHFCLTGRWITDHSLASATGLQDTHRLAWDEGALALAGIGAQQLPELVSTTAVVGEVTLSAAQQTRLPVGLQVIAGASDGALANLGAGAFSPGQTAITVGTSGAIRHLVDHPRFDPRERTWCYILGEGRWLAGGAINNAGLAVQWVRDRFFPDPAGGEAYHQLMREAGAVSPGAEGVIVVPYFTGERNPHWDSHARAMFFGLSLEHTRAHMARAVLEGVAFCLADVWEALSDAGAYQNIVEPVRLTGGITQAPVWAQIVADVLGISLVAVEAADASAIGAAMLGYCALQGRSLESMAEWVQVGKIYLPDTRRHAFYRTRHRVFQEMYRQLRTI